MPERPVDSNERSSGPDSAPPSPLPRIVRFGIFELDRQARELRRQGSAIRLQEQPFRILEMLLEQPGDVVTRQDIRARLWSGHAVVDFDHGINNAVKRLREVLRDRAEAPVYLETLPRLGYRFIYPVQRDVTNPTTPDSSPAAAVPTSRPIDRNGRPLWKRAIPLAVLVLLLAVAGLFRLVPDREVADPARIALAVQPFLNTGSAAEDDYLAWAITEGVAAAMRQRGHPTTVLPQGVPDSPTQHEFSWTIAGDVGRVGSGVEISVRVQRGIDGTLLWSGRYAGELLQLETLQQELAHDLVGKLDGQPMETASGNRSPADSAAYAAYLKGRFLFNQRNKEALHDSLVHFREATRLDRQYAAAYAGIAESYAVLGGWTIPNTGFDRGMHDHALQAAKRALELDDGSSEAHVAMALALGLFAQERPELESEIAGHYARALALDPHNARAHHAYGLFLASQDRFESAIVQYQAALSLDPISPNVSGALAMALCVLGHCAEAAERLRGSVELDPWQFNTRVRLGWVLLELNDVQGALAQFEAAETISPGSRSSLVGLGYCLGQLGRTEAARAVLARLAQSEDDQRKPVDTAIVLTGMGEIDAAIRVLREAIAVGDRPRSRGPLLHWGSHVFDPLRSDPRFAEIRKADQAGAGVSRAPGETGVRIGMARP